MIKGDKVNLRPVMREDLPLLESWANNLDFTSEFNFFGIRNPANSEKNFNEDGMLSPKNTTFIIVTQDGTRVGDISFREVPYGPSNNDRVYMIGISLVGEHRGKGYGTEAQKLITSYLFSTYNIMRVEASTDIENLPEQRSLEKAGFTREGVLRKSLWRAGAYRDMVIYSKLRGE